MKFELKKTELKKFGNFEMFEYPERNKFPLDGAVVKVKDSYEKIKAFFDMGEKHE